MSRSQREIQVPALMRAGAAAEAAGNLRGRPGLPQGCGGDDPRVSRKGRVAGARPRPSWARACASATGPVSPRGVRARSGDPRVGARVRTPLASARPTLKSWEFAARTSGGFWRPDRSISGRSIFSNHGWARAMRRRHRIYHNLGGLEHSAGNWARGEPFARMSVRIRKRALGSRHPIVAHDMTALAALLDRQKKYDEAERLYKALNRHLRTGARAGTSRGLGRSQQPGGRPSSAWSAEAGRAAVPPRARHRHDAPRRRSPARGLLREQPRHAAEIAWTVFRSRRSLPAGAARLHARARRAASERRRLPGELRRGPSRARAPTRSGRQRAARGADSRARRGGERRGCRDDRHDQPDVRAIPAHREEVAHPSPRRLHRRTHSAAAPGDRVHGRADRPGARGGAAGIPSAATFSTSIRTGKLTARSAGAAPRSSTTRAIRICARGSRTDASGYYSVRAIARGEELTVDYRYDSDLKPMPCYCGAKTCRGTMNLAPARR